MRDARNVRDGEEEEFTLETTSQQAIMEQFGLTPEEFEAAVAQVTVDAENLDVFGVINVTDELPCISTLSEYTTWHSGVGLTSDVNTDYQLYVALCEATDEENIFIPITQNIPKESNNKLLKTGLMVGGALLLFKALSKK